MLAAQNGNLDTLKWLVDTKKGDIRAKDKVTPRPVPTLGPFALFSIFDTFIGFVYARFYGNLQAGRTALKLCKNPDVRRWMIGYIKRNPSSTRKGKDKTDEPGAKRRKTVANIKSKRAF